MAELVDLPGQYLLASRPYRQRSGKWIGQMQVALRLDRGRYLLGRALDGLSAPLNVFAHTLPGVAAVQAEKKHCQSKYAAQYLPEFTHGQTP